ncbi:MAG: 2Fe-2S iron-sulfur cluster-binding protein [Alphaproteobacteria bacterium]|nr:2Fe-2S iron-sulfur cluster-binding protein [Alphaproteobacteria bacterium]
MPKIIFNHPDGTSETVEAKAGTSVMLAALTSGVDGIEAECGGSCMCATCHVYIDEAWLDRLPKVQILEDEMLDDTAAERASNSRLSCQIEMTEDLDGLIVTLPDMQI